MLFKIIILQIVLVCIYLNILILILNSLTIAKKQVTNIIFTYIQQAVCEQYFKRILTLAGGKFTPPESQSFCFKRGKNLINGIGFFYGIAIGIMSCTLLHLLALVRSLVFRLLQIISFRSKT